MIPGDGELPLADFAAALTPEVRIGVETPALPELERGSDLRTVLHRAVSACRELLAAAPAARSPATPG